MKTYLNKDVTIKRNNFHLRFSTKALLNNLQKNDLARREAVYLFGNHFRTSFLQ